MKQEKKLKIEYDFPENNKFEIIDNAIAKVVKRLGYKFEGSGFNMKTNKRDLVFYK